ncbi:MAG: signal recognition particle protein Srp19 [Methanosarcinales archaeon]|nr:signal recognition particle protein Srp19 [Methanosarcinales archaeon]
MPRKDRLVIWPAYIDSERSRSQGRIVSKEDAVRDPKLDEITFAAMHLGLDPEVERDKAYPKHWYEKRGRVLVLKKEPKSRMIKKIARAVRKKRR